MACKKCGGQYQWDGKHLLCEKCGLLAPYQPVPSYEDLLEANAKLSEELADLRQKLSPKGTE